MRGVDNLLDYSVGAGAAARSALAHEAALATPSKVKMWMPSMPKPSSWRCAAANSRRMTSGVLAREQVGDRVNPGAERPDRIANAAGERVFPQGAAVGRAGEPDAHRLTVARSR